MTKKQPNPLQKMVRGFLRDLINNANEQKPTKYSKPKPKNLNLDNPKLENKSKNKKQSRHIPASVRVSVLTRDNYQCRFCGRKSTQVQLEIDHIKPFSKGGTHEINNLQTLCIDCNRGKGARFLK